jgi:S-adenosylmethionine decarboxylase
MAHDSLAQIGMNTEAEAKNARAEVEIQVGRSIGRGDHDRGDHFVERNGLRYAGSHLLIDLWDGEHFDDIGMIELALRRAVAAAGATLLHLHLHEFGAGGGVSGVAVLAESHISIHTWPEHSYAAVDAFMCGAAAPHKVVPILRQAFKARRVVLFEQMRGAL